MLEDKEIDNFLEEIDEEDSATDENSLAVLDLDSEEKKLLQELVSANSETELQNVLASVNNIQLKKDICRNVIFNRILDASAKQTLERLEKRPDQIPNKELVELINVAASQIDRVKKSNQTESTPIGLVKPVVVKEGGVVNIGTNLPNNGGGTDEVVDAIKDILKQLNNNKVVDTQNDDSAVNVDFTKDNSENIVYNNDSVVIEQNENINKGESND